MDDNICDKTTEINKITRALSVISGKWKPSILVCLRYMGTQRFSELQRLMPEITIKMLTVQLRELERDGLVIRKTYAQVPPKVEYSLSDYGKTLDPVLNTMHTWGEQHIARGQDNDH